MAQAKPSAAAPGKPSASQQKSYFDLDSDDGYEKYRGNCGEGYTQVVMEAGGYTKWFEEATGKLKDNVYDDARKITFGVTFGGLMRDRLKFPALYTYDYDIVLRIVRGEKRFIGGCISSHEFVYSLYVRTSVEKQNEIVGEFLKRFSIIPTKTDASIYKDKRRSLSLGVGSPSNPVALLVDRTSKDDKAGKDDEGDKDDKGDKKEKDKDVNADADAGAKDDAKEEVAESKYEHRVCNAHENATDKKIKDSAESDIKKRIAAISDKYSVSVSQGIPDFSAKDEPDIIVAFVKDDIFRFQATYLSKSTFKDDAKAKKSVYDTLYKWPKSAKEIFGKDNIPKQNTKGLLSVFTTVSSTKVDIASD